jgi:hypothetical protein
MRIMLIRIVLLAALLMASSGASAATLNVVGGQLVGASGVNVGGNLGVVDWRSCAATSRP